MLETLKAIKRTLLTENIYQGDNSFYKTKMKIALKKRILLVTQC